MADHCYYYKKLEISTWECKTSACRHQLEYHTYMLVSIMQASNKFVCHMQASHTNKTKKNSPT
jgi:hypothetical protein